MNEEICTKGGGMWGEKNDLFDDGAHNSYFACDCPKTKSDESYMIFEGSPEKCSDIKN